jgi:NAD(P)-dependent dehydrogenase (short-subunit alcohol dehydrogenase family)
MKENMIKSIVITGCSKRIGLGIIKYYCEESDYKLIAVVRKVSKDLENLKKIYNNRVEIIIKDLDKDDLDEIFFEKIINKNETIVGLFHCASNFLFDDEETFNEDNLKCQNRIHYEIFDNAINSYLNLSERYQLKERASFINFGDYKIYYGQKTGISYSESKNLAMKAIKIQAMKTLGKARVNMVSPGYTLATEGYDENYEEIVKNFPFGYSSSISDICDTVNFLLNQHSITGQNIVVDAGAGLKL